MTYRPPITLTKSQRRWIAASCEDLTSPAPTDSLSRAALIATLVILALGCVLIWGMQ